ncbi:MAG: hypothetical protein KZQ99_18505 [Candidatus Thiodiazotropha sp. (ex Dulcina madagascariensis)]|nr:hypothetical protein [Candidatus Thiodiazotropha sp. (ex Dulcina madagascariensis)]
MEGFDFLLMSSSAAVRLELRQHPESDLIDRANINEEDFVTAPLSKGYSKRRMINMPLGKTVRVIKQKDKKRRLLLM